MRDPRIAYEWATIRVVPHVHREQFVNVGVLLHARRAEALLVRILPRWQRVTALDPAFEIAVAEEHLESFRRVAEGREDAGPVALLPPSERFHWLTAPRSAVVQTSAVRPGLTSDLAKTLRDLFEEQCG